MREKYFLFFIYTLFFIFLSLGSPKERNPIFAANPCVCSNSCCSGSCSGVWCDDCSKCSDSSYCPVKPGCTWKVPCCNRGETKSCTTAGGYPGTRYCNDNCDWGACYCETTCSWPYCGENDGCGGTCSSSSNVNTYGGWGACSNSCGDGTQSRSCSNPCSTPSSWTETQDCCNCEDWCSCNASCSAPDCGGSANGQRCAGSSCNEGCTENCDDDRSSVWNDPGSSFTHDMPITISGWAKDTNGPTDGVHSIHVYRDGDPGSGTHFATLLADSGSGAFSGPVQTDFYTSGFTGSESHTIHLWAIKRDSNDCNNWKLRNSGPGQRNISITNSAPQNAFITPNSGDVVLDHGGPDGVGLSAVFNDSDSQVGVLGRDQDVRDARVRIGESGSHIALITYTDIVPGGGSIAFNNGGSGITMTNEGASAIQGISLTLRFDLNFSGLSAADAGAYNVYMYSRDWAGAVDNWQLMGTLDIWNGQDVAVTGVVHNITNSYPDSSCDNFNTNIGGGIIVNFDDGVNPIITDTTGGSGEYSVDLIYGDTYSYSLDGGDTYTGWLANLGEVTDLAQGCEGGAGIFTVNTSGADQPNLDFGMTENLDPWIQIIGGSVTSYSSVTDIIPSTCENDRDLGGDCLPFITIADPSLGFDENGIVVARLDIVEGPDAPEIGDPNDWRVVDTDLWQKTSRGYSYYEARLTNSLDAGEDIYLGDTNISAITGLDDGNVASGEEEVKLVDGNLTIDQNLTVVNGGAMMIIVSGNITVNDNVDQLQGIYLADGSITINGDETSDQAFLGGTFYADIDANGSGRINNTRDRGVSNNTEPPVTFQYRPDLLINLLKSSVGDRIFETTIVWEEIKP